MELEVIEERAVLLDFNLSHFFENLELRYAIDTPYLRCELSK